MKAGSFQDCPDPKKVRELYEASFPVEERMPFFIISRKEKGRDLRVWLEGEELIGLTYLYHYRDLSYLSYICVESTYQDEGYGSKILQEILKEYPQQRIIVDIEKLDEDAENAAERERRRQFYLRNGFQSDEIGYFFYDVDYELLSAHGLINEEDWKRLMMKHWGAISLKAKVGKYLPKD